MARTHSCSSGQRHPRAERHVAVASVFMDQMLNSILGKEGTGYFEHRRGGQLCSGRKAVLGVREICTTRSICTENILGVFIAAFI